MARLICTTTTWSLQTTATQSQSWATLHRVNYTSLTTAAVQQSSRMCLALRLRILASLAGRQTAHSIVTTTAVQSGLPTPRQTQAAAVVVAAVM